MVTGNVRKVVYFDRLKPCISEVTPTVNQHQITQDRDQPTKYAASSANVPPPLGQIWSC